MSHTFASKFVHFCVGVADLDSPWPALRAERQQTRTVKVPRLIPQAVPGQKKGTNTPKAPFVNWFAQVSPKYLKTALGTGWEVTTFDDEGHQNPRYSL